MGFRLALLLFYKDVFAVKWTSKTDIPIKQKTNQLTWAIFYLQNYGGGFQKRNNEII